MGDIADAIIDGYLCQVCMAPIVDPIGCPTTCKKCKPKRRRKRGRPNKTNKEV